MSEFDALVAADGIIMAGRFGPDGLVAEYKTKGLYIGNPVAAQMMNWFCAAISTMFASTADAIDCVRQTGFDESSWLPVKGWSYTGDDNAIAVSGDRVAIRRARVRSLDELDHLLRDGQPSAERVELSTGSRRLSASSPNASSSRGTTFAPKWLPSTANWGLRSAARR